MFRLKNDKLFYRGARKASSCLANKNETPITYDRFFLPSRGLQHHFRFPRATIYPRAYLTGYVGIYSIRVSEDGRRRGIFFRLYQFSTGTVSSHP